MSCLRIDITYPNKGFKVGTDNYNGIGVSTTLLNRLQANTDCYNGFKIEALLVCSVNRKEFIYVNPTQAMWVTVDKSIDYYITSNTNWIIN